MPVRYTRIQEDTSFRNETDALVKGYSAALRIEKYPVVATRTRQVNQPLQDGTADPAMAPMSKDRHAPDMTVI